jgi:hypothetical protein
MCKLDFASRLFGRNKNALAYEECRKEFPLED